MTVSGVADEMLFHEIAEPAYMLVVVCPSLQFPTAMPNSEDCARIDSGLSSLKQRLILNVLPQRRRS